jgi:hypothetical protein
MKLPHNRAITIGDKLLGGIPLGKQKSSKRKKKWERLNKMKHKRKIKEAYAEYGSLEEIRKARMEKYTERKGWIKLPASTT